MYSRTYLIGNLGKDPESKMTSAGKTVTTFSLATKGVKDVTDWHNIVCFDKLAEICIQYLKKGSKVFVEAQIKYDQYEKDGKKVFFTKLIANHVTFLDDKSIVKALEPTNDYANIDNSDLPF